MGLYQEMANGINPVDGLDTYVPTRGILVSTTMMGNENTEITGTEEALQEEGGGGEAYMFQQQFYPDARFHVVSTELQGMSTPAGAGEGQFLSSFDNRLVQYTGARDMFAFFFPYEDAEIQQGVLYRLGGDWADIGENGDGGGGDTPSSNLVNVTFSPVGGDGGDDGDWFDDV